MNRWNIPALLEREIVQRDAACVYCGVVFGSNGRAGSRITAVLNARRRAVREA